MRLIKTIAPKVSIIVPVIVTEGMIDGSTGSRVFGVFGSARDARATDADRRALATISADDLTDGQRAIARANSERL